jgi:TolB-like protein/tetratricopeptide (TPR) repeat protein
MHRSVRFDCFEVDLVSGELRKNGLRIHLREQSFQALALLLEQPGEVVTREELRRRLWSADIFVDFDNNLNNAIGRLREALGDSAERPRFIETLPKRGYRFIAAASPGSPPAESAAPARARLMVLPFLNLSGDPRQDYFTDAMTEEIITELAALSPRDLAVIARTTAMRYKGTDKDVERIGREVSVDYVVEGAVRCQENLVTITVQLLRARDQTHMLARRYEADLHDVFDVRSTIAEAIGGELGVRRQPQAGDRPLRKATQDPVAYNLYLRGRSQLAKETPEGFTTAKQCFEEAIARDPRFALACDALAELYWYLGFFGLAPAKEVSATGMFYAMQALDIDDTLAETHALLGLYRKELDFNWADVKREMDRARELNPASPLVRVRYAVGWLLPECRLAEAAAEIELALESDPQSTFLRGWLGCMLWLDGQYDGAIEQGRLVVGFDSAAFTGHWLLGLFYREQGRFDEAIAAHRIAVERSGGSPLTLGWLGLALGQAGRTAEARAVLERLHAIASAGYVPPTSFAWTHHGLGEIDQAFVWMDRAVDARDHMIMPIQSYRFLDPVRTDPRYVALLRKLNYRTEGTGTCRPPSLTTNADASRAL